MQCSIFHMYPDYCCKCNVADANGIRHSFDKEINQLYQSIMTRFEFEDLFSDICGTCLVQKESQVP